MRLIDSSRSESFTVLRQWMSLFSQPKKLFMPKNTAVCTFTLLLILLSGQQIVLGAFGAGTQWDARVAGDGGLDTNGGAFDPGVVSPGTDESQGSGTAITVTAATTTGTGSPAFSSTTHGPGNFIHIASGAGCNTGTFEILSQAAGTATFDRSMGTGTCVGVIGGSLLTIQTAITLAVTSNIVNIKAGTYTVTTAILVNAGSTFLSGQIIGYGTTHGDAGTKPLITTATNSTQLFNIQGAGAGTLQFQNLSLSNTAGTRGGGFFATNSSATLVVIDSILDGFSQGIWADNVTPNFFVAVYVISSEIKNCTGNGITEDGPIYVTDSYIHNNATGINDDANNAQLWIVRSIIAANTANGAQQIGSTQFNRLIGSVFANNGSNGFSGSGTQALAGLIVEDCIFYGNGSSGTAYGLDLFAGTVPVVNRNNAYGANRTAARLNLAAGTNDVTLTSDPFVNSGTGNYALNSTAGGGAALKEAGFPGVFPGGTSTGYLDIGAVQTSGAPGIGGVSGGAFVQ